MQTVYDSNSLLAAVFLIIRVAIGPVANFIVHACLSIFDCAVYVHCTVNSFMVCEVLEPILCINWNMQRKSKINSIECVIV